MTGKRGKPQGPLPILVVVSFALLGGFSLWYWGAPNEDFLRLQEEYLRERGEGGAVGDFEPTEGTRLAQRYAIAVRDGRCREIVEHTWWMQERLEHARAGGGGLQAEEAALSELCEQLQERTASGNRLRPEGVEDRYVFTSMADVEIVDVDTGRSDLARTVHERVWMRVRYPVPTHALRDENGTAIKSLHVGLNVSEGKYLVKAGVVGNLEINYESISYSW